jgi:hypothetical protein
MRIILTKEEHEVRLRNPKGTIMISIRGGADIAHVATYSDISGTDVSRKG